MAGSKIIHLGVPAQTLRVRVFTPVAGLPAVTAGRRPDAATVLDHLRTDTRPSLVGIIPGLTPEMEEAFRDDRIVIQNHQEHGREIYTPQRVGYGETLSGASWSELGLSGSPSDGEKQLGFQAYLAWTGHELFPETRNTAPRASRGVMLANPRSEEQLRFVEQLLAVLPGGVLDRAAVAAIDLNGQDDACRLGRYDLTRKTVTVYNNVDRYVLARLLLHQVGRAVFHTLGHGEVQQLTALAAACEQRRATFGADVRGDASAGRGSFQTLQDFFADNFRHFIIAGAGMAGHSQNWALRGQLFDFYAELFPSK